MDPLENELFRGVRPSDLRFENAHLLAEYIHQTQALVDSAAATQKDSKNLLYGVHIITRDGVQRFKAAGDDLAAIAATAMSGIRAVGADLIDESRRAILLPVTELTAAAKRLEAAAAAAEKERQEASDASTEFIRYQEEVDTYVATTLSSLNAELGARSFWKRLVDVFAPTKVTISATKAPARPTMPKK